jgi:hypothetical protein
MNSALPPPPATVSLWGRHKQWIRPLATLLLLAAIVWWVATKASRYWNDMASRAASVSVPTFLLAAVMFALFLFGVRAVSWRRILRGFGYPLPLAPAVRIWSTSELARYVPLSVWQVAGRVVLVRPYGVSAAACAASQVLELVIFLLANILVGVSCLAVYGFRNVHGQARWWLVALVALVPLLVMLLHPRVFYGVLEAVLRRMGKPPLTARLPLRELFLLLGWAIIGLLWQSVAIVLIVRQPLGLHWSKWYVVAGSYCLAWCAGFLAFMFPAGFGVREPVFVVAMRFALPWYVQQKFQSKVELDGLLLFLSGLLRLWTISGELIVAATAYATDFRGAIGRAPRPAAAAGEPAQ